MGSWKYQNDNDFDVYVSEHGGSSNAFTDCEHVSAGVYFYIRCYVFICMQWLLRRDRRFVIFIKISIDVLQ